MTFPDPAVMYLLLALELGEQLAVSADGSLTLTIPAAPGPVVIPSLPDCLDALESRGWVEIPPGDAPPRVTEQGRYAVGRWMTRVTGRKGRLVRNLRWERVE